MGITRRGFLKGLSIAVPSAAFAKVSWGIDKATAAAFPNIGPLEKIAGLQTGFVTPVNGADISVGRTMQVQFIKDGDIFIPNRPIKWTVNDLAFMTDNPKGENWVTVKRIQVFFAKDHTPRYSQPLGLLLSDSDGIELQNLRILIGD